MCEGAEEQVRTGLWVVFVWRINSEPKDPRHIVGRAVFTDKQGRLEPPLLDVWCFFLKSEERGAARRKAPVAKADRRPEPMWKECKWKCANFLKSFLSLKDKGALGIDCVTQRR